MLITRSHQGRIIDFIAKNSVSIFISIREYRVFILAALTTCVFFLPALLDKSQNAGLLYSGDVLGYYLPALMKTQALLHRYHFFALDYSLFNGSSDFFLSPNFFALHPFVVLYSLLFPLQGLAVSGQFLVLLLALHCFLACYFTMKLLTRFFAFELGRAFLVAIGFAFSWYMICSLMQPPFLICASIIPWVMYSTLRYQENPKLSFLVRAAFPIIMGFLGGYLPLGIACLAMSAVFVMAKIGFIDSALHNTAEKTVTAIILAALPFILALFITSPFLYAVFKFHHETSSAQTSGIFYSAFQLAEAPNTIMRIISTRFSVPGQFIEFSVFWGVIASIIFFTFFLSLSNSQCLGVQEWKLFKIVAVIYIAILLAIYGRYSAVSSLVYYFIPQIGKMHIYQRFLLPGQLFFMILLALMLKALINADKQTAAKYMFIIITIITFLVAFLLTYHAAFIQAFGINNFFLFELILACLFTVILLIPGQKFIYYGTAILFCLPAINQIYDLSLDGNTLLEQRKRQPIALDLEEQNKLIAYMQKFSDKKIIKYVDITPMWTKSGIETFPKDFPYFVLKKINLSSYGGFTFYLSAKAEYMRRMPIGEEVAIQPDWQWLQATGADFLLARKENLTNPALREIITRVKLEDLYNLPNDAVLIPLKFPATEDHVASAVFDNGYLRVLSSSAEPKAWTNLALNTKVKQSSDGGGGAQLAIDGNTDGDFNHGSVTHTANDLNAWLEIDLGHIKKIDRIQIWNRTDCCSKRLSNYWVFISNNPFLPTDTADKLKSRPATWAMVGPAANPMSSINTHEVRGQYVRVQLAGTQSLAESFLSLAEVEILQQKKLNSMLPSTQQNSFELKNFYSNNANLLRFEFKISKPTVVQYLFWHNARLKYFLNGKAILPTNYKGLYSIAVPAGNNTIEIRYIHRPLILFWVFYIIFGLAFLIAWIFDLISDGVRWPCRSDATRKCVNTP